MKQSYSILICLFSFLLLQENDDPGCGVFRNRRKTDALFQDSRTLKLNCDQSFSFKHSGCIHPDTSYGTWTLQGDKIILTTTKKLKKLVQKEERTKSGYTFSDMSGAKLYLHDAYIIWIRSSDWSDTLYKN